jgi:hypothetical protein
MWLRAPRADSKSERVTGFIFETRTIHHKPNDTPHQAGSWRLRRSIRPVWRRPWPWMTRTREADGRPKFRV